MKQQVLKALANPPRIFFVPYYLAVLNFVVQFIIFVVIYVSALVFFDFLIDPVLFLISVILVHMLLAAYSQKDPQIGQIILSRFQLLKRKIPRRLAA